MKCPSCGRENRVKAGFCAWCGSRFNAEPESAKAAPAATTAAAVPQKAPPEPRVTAPEAAPPVEEQAAETTAPEPPPSTGTEKPSPLSGGTPEGVEAAETTAAKTPAEGKSQAAPESTGPEVPEQAPEQGAAPAAESAPGTPFRPGDVLAGHYTIEELVESNPERNVYRARDLGRCAACGYDDNIPGEEYCRQCGASLEQPAYVRITEELRRIPAEYDMHFSEGERDYYVTAEPKEEAAPPPQKAGEAPLRLIWGRATDKGLQRDLNEDTLEVWLYARGSGGVVGLFVVADGLGGQDSGEVASRLATDTVWQELRQSIWEPILRGETLGPDDVQRQLATAGGTANQAVYETRLARKSEMSTTLTMALIIDNHAYIGNVGDSRTYLWNADGLRRITKDHSLVQRLVDTGQITPQEVYTHPQRHLIYQSIGDRAQVQVDVFRHHLSVDDHLILCSDGLWEMVREEGLEEVLLAEPDPQRACERLVQNANLAGGEDNISVIIVWATGA